MYLCVGPSNDDSATLPLLLRDDHAPPDTAVSGLLGNGKHGWVLEAESDLSLGRGDMI